MTALLVGISCIAMNFFLNKTAYYYMDSLNGYIADVESDEKIYIKIDEDKIDDFFSTFSNQVVNTKINFSKKSALITLIISLSGGILSYIISGKSLKPLDDFSQKIEKIELKNIKEYQIRDEEIKEFEKIKNSFNRMLKRLDESYKAEKEFTRGAAHELKTPLAIINSQIDLYDEMYMNDDEVKDLIHMIKNESDRLKKLVTNLLDISELNSIKRDEKIEISSLIEEVNQDLAYLSDKKNISIENKCDESYILGNDILIYRVFYNIIENAMKYNKKDGYIKIYSKIKKESIKIFIEDSGIGIENNERDKVFIPFYRINKENQKEKGSGLGLSLIYKTIKIHGGEIKILDSKIGAKFSIKFPLI
ncbi:HAMP domain-containing sensor histidine kinase [Anaerococcus porci]|uniref:sensor histidine kinase n=1 Tax=Anaerococcus porci TaxID=2652269 RepID=UPI002A76191C|nr:HAMP domain-containing sensor histidine kinase [Anaerococcus porci]MDY3006380.1 HAMP domain-containing sensor histidine kinase [Anaerococcus porci]